MTWLGLTSLTQIYNEREQKGTKDVQFGEEKRLGLMKVDKASTKKSPIIDKDISTIK